MIITLSHNPIDTCLEGTLCRGLCSCRVPSTTRCWGRCHSGQMQSWRWSCNFWESMTSGKQRSERCWKDMSHWSGRLRSTTSPLPSSSQSGRTICMWHRSDRGMTPTPDEWRNGQRQDDCNACSDTRLGHSWQSLRCHTCTGQRSRRQDKPYGLALHSQCACGSTFRSTCSRPEGRRKAAGWIFPPSSGEKAAEWSQLVSPNCASDHREGLQGLRKPLGVEKAPAGSRLASPAGESSARGRKEKSTSAQ
jgi:hypothetical protein